MKPLLCLLLCLTSTTTPLLSSSAQEAQPIPQAPSLPSNDLVQKFELYKQALTEKNGELAGQLICNDTIFIYENYRDAALSGTPEELMQLPLIHQAGILILRGNIPPEELSQQSGLQIYANSIDLGFIANNWAKAMGVIEIEYPEQGVAILTIGVNGNPATALVAFNEMGEWKFSLREVLNQANEQIIKILQEKGIPPEEYLMSVLQKSVPKETLGTIWEPPATRIRRAESNP